MPNIVSVIDLPTIRALPGERFAFHPVGAEPILISVCAACRLLPECKEGQAFPVWGCADFDDGYEGPEYPDADSWREWIGMVYGHQRQTV